MEYALRGPNWHVAIWRAAVLILVLMEYALRDYENDAKKAVRQS